MHTSVSTIFTPALIKLPQGEELLIRLLEPTDASKLGDYFNGLSDQSKRYFAPHRFDSETVDTICATLNPTECIRLVGISPVNQTIVAYTLLGNGATPSDTARYKSLGIDLNPETDCSLAPSVADTYQGRGLGGYLLQKALSIARILNKERVILWGGVQASNERAVRYYQKQGFIKLSEFEHNGPNYDMCLQVP